MKVAGHYIRTGGEDSAELRITPSIAIGDRYHVDGLALWGERRQNGPNLGLVEFSGDLEGNAIRHVDPHNGYTIVLTFSEAGLVVSEENAQGVHGMNVTFNGAYRRAGSVGGFFVTLRRALRRLSRP